MKFGLGISPTLWLLMVGEGSIVVEMLVRVVLRLAGELTISSSDLRDGTSSDTVTEDGDDE